LKVLTESDLRGEDVDDGPEVGLQDGGDGERDGSAANRSKQL
jgi:hypothetical protein